MQLDVPSDSQERPLLSKNVKDRVKPVLLKTKTFGCGVVTLYYESAKNDLASYFLFAPFVKT
jgi:hypothetical protein